MPYYRWENLRKKIILGKFDAHQVEVVLSHVFDFVFNHFYHRIVSPAPKNYLETKHFNRFLKRFEMIKTIRPFSEIIDKDKIFINGEEFNNLYWLMDKIINLPNYKKLFNPKNLVIVHGDLHFQNILCNDSGEQFILMDPRGELMGSDLFYDLGKVWHSVNGLYDLIHTDISSYFILENKIKYCSFSLTLGNHSLLQIYSEIKNKVQQLLQIYAGYDKNWFIKMEFNEAMHFASLMFFHLKRDGKENRAVCLYLQAVRLLTNLLKNIN